MISFIWWNLTKQNTKQVEKRKTKTRWRIDRRRILAWVMYAYHCTPIFREGESPQRRKAQTCSRTEIMLCLWNHKCRAHWVVSALLTCPFVFPLRESAPSPTCRWTQANSCKSSEQSTRILWPRSTEYLAKDNRQYWPAGDRNPGKVHAWRTDQPIGRLSSLETRKNPIELGDLQEMSLGSW
jgi:hypothetical protein